MTNSFSNLGVSTPILKALDEIGFESPTEVQSKAIPHILNKEDLIVKSKTGSGKTAVFGVSVLQMTDPDVNEPQGLILTPTRELAVQIDSDIKQISKYLHHKTLAVYGQHNISTEIQALNKGVSIVTGTPGRVSDHICHGNLKTKNIRFLVLDEADRMLDMGFLDQVVKIIKTLPRDRITLLFSATIPADINRICRDYMKHPSTIEIESPTKTVDTIKQAHYRVNKNEKNTKLNLLLLNERPDSCIIFCNTRISVDRVQSFLSRKGYACNSLHGDIPQNRRMKTIEQFREGKFHILIATDVAARGIHIEGLSLVINYDVPIEKDSYVHRIGRTGRAGNIGRAITFATSEDIMSLYEIEEHIGVMIPEEDFPPETELDIQNANVQEWIKENKIKSTSAVRDTNYAYEPVCSNMNKRNNSKVKHTQSLERHKSESGRVNIKSKTNMDGALSIDTIRHDHNNSKKVLSETAKSHIDAHDKNPTKKTNSRSVKPKQSTNINGENHLKVTRTVHVGRSTETNANSTNYKPNSIIFSRQALQNNISNELVQTPKPKHPASLLRRLLQLILGKK